MKIGEIYKITCPDDLGRKEVTGLVLKVLDDGRFYVKVLETISEDDLIYKRLSSWGRYGIGDRTGLFIDPRRSRFSYRKINSCNSRFVVNKQVYITVGYKTTESRQYMKGLSQYVSYKKGSKIDNKTTVVTVKSPTDKRNDLTYVLLGDKNVGAVVYGVGDSKTGLATHKALCYYYENL